MGRVSSRAQIQAQLRSAQRQAERKFRADVDRVNRENQRRVDGYNRRVTDHNRRAVDGYSREVANTVAQIEAINWRNRQADAHNRAVIADLRRRLSAVSPHMTFTSAEQALVERVRDHVLLHPEREWDAFLCYAHVDGLRVATNLYNSLEALGVRVWFFPAATKPGLSQSLQIDLGLATSRCGIVVLTPAFLKGRFWTQRELGSLLNKDILVPVLHGVTFEDVRAISGILPDLSGFTTSQDPVKVIAAKIASALLASE